jgi:hypothetical protein
MEKVTAAVQATPGVNQRDPAGSTLSTPSSTSAPTAPWPPSLAVDTRRQVPTEQDPAAGGPPADHTAAARPRPDHGGANHAP